jgi:hypothetical protein
VAPVLAHADPITVNGSGGSFSAFPSTIGSFGSPFWNGKSSDYADGKGSVGYYLTGTGDFTGGLLGSPSISPSDLQQFVKAGGTADTLETFSTAAGVSAQLYVTIAANASTNVFGYYDSTGMHQLFNGSGSADFTPVGTFGFYLQTASDGTFFSNASLNQNTGGQSAYTTEQHFAVFQQTSTGTLYIGVEDLPFNISDTDYNDLIVSLSAVAVPEPASIAMLCLGGLVLGGYRVARRKQPMSMAV